MIEIRELVLHPIQLMEVELISCNLSKNINNDKSINRNDILVKFKSWAEIDKNNGQAGYTFLNLNIDFQNEDKPFVIDITYRGTCLINESEFESREFIKFLEAQGIKLLLPYMKTALSDFMVRMELTPIRIPTIDVLKTMEKSDINERK